MDEGEHDVLAHMAFPKEHRLQIHGTNPPEHCNGDVKRRSNVAGIFPNDAAIVRLVGTLLLDQNDECSIQRRYMTLKTLAGMRDNPRLRLPAIAARM